MQQDEYDHVEALVSSALEDTQTLANSLNDLESQAWQVCDALKDIQEQLEAFGVDSADDDEEGDDNGNDSATETG